MSTPESGSSNMVKSGIWASSCKISERFTSPPENPKLTSLSRNSSLNLSWSANAFILGFNSSSISWWDSILSRSLTETPLIAGGVWKLTPKPNCTLSAVVNSVISWPLNLMDPSTTSYCGKPKIVKNKVLFPAPLGPKRTWVSPSSMERLTPFKTLLPATSTAKFSISSNI